MSSGLSLKWSLSVGITLFLSETLLYAYRLSSSQCCHPRSYPSGQTCTNPAHGPGKSVQEGKMGQYAHSWTSSLCSPGAISGITIAESTQSISQARNPPGYHERCLHTSLWAWMETYSRQCQRRAQLRGVRWWVGRLCVAESNAETIADLWASWQSNCELKFRCYLLWRYWTSALGLASSSFICPLHSVQQNAGG